MKNQCIWFICKDAAPLSESGVFLRTLKQAQFFKKKGYNVKIICSSRVHNTSINHLGKGFFIEKEYDGIKYLFVKSYAYSTINIKRLISYFLFSLKIIRLTNFFIKPDVIVHSSRIPFDYPVYIYAKVFKSRYILDVTDLWPLEFEHFEYLNHNNPILKLFYLIEKHLYTNANYVVSSLEGFKDYIIEKRWDLSNGGSVDLSKVHYVNTGIDLDEYKYNLFNYSIEDNDLNDKDSFKIIYLGSIRKANNLEKVLEAAQLLLHYSQIKFLIYGDGTEREMLEDRCRKEKITNIIFKDKWIKPIYVPYVLSKASVNLINYIPGWAPYGGSMNKMFMAIASGKPIICNAGMNYSLIKNYNIGIDKAFSDSQEYAEAILSIYQMDKNSYEELCSRCKNAAHIFDIKELLNKFAIYCNL